MRLPDWLMYAGVRHYSLPDRYPADGVGEAADPHVKQSPGGKI